MATALQEFVSQEIKQLTDQQLKEVLIFIEFINMREDSDFIEYVNKKTRQAESARKKGIKFRSLEELQEEYKYCNYYWDTRRHI
jgi:succinate dehydrogenase flavin-adding protein (antitoxin of CptAB toxin-antitoxin module)